MDTGGLGYYNLQEYLAHLTVESRSSENDDQVRVSKVSSTALT